MATYWCAKIACHVTALPNPVEYCPDKKKAVDDWRSLMTADCQLPTADLFLAAAGSSTTFTATTSAGITLIFHGFEF